MSSVSVSIPADPAYIGLLRSACAHVAAEADLTIDEIEDLRIAVSEAATLLIAHSEEIQCVLTPKKYAVEVICSAATEKEFQINEDDLAWVVLSALATATPIQTDSHISITLTKERVSQQL